MTDYAPQEFSGGSAVPEPEGWPFRHVALYCDASGGPCDAEVDADIRADRLEDALPGLRRYAREQGWQAADDGSVPDLCPAHKDDPGQQALLGVPGAGDEVPDAAVD